MTPEKLYLLLSTKFPTAETDWTGHERVPEPPFAVYLFRGIDNICADNRVYASENRYTVELYVRKRDYHSEKKLEDLFDKNDIFWNKDKIWNRELGLFQVIYEI
ncbi:MAG: hypothetical protein J5994_10865 [Ruminococcus sp.]|nr:hypothetical protein [Ruminococcus sp.]